MRTIELLTTVHGYRLFKDAIQGWFTLSAGTSKKDLQQKLQPTLWLRVCFNAAAGLVMSPPITSTSTASLTSSPESPAPATASPVPPTSTPSPTEAPTQKQRNTPANTLKVSSHWSGRDSELKVCTLLSLN